MQKRSDGGEREENSGRKDRSHRGQRNDRTAHSAEHRTSEHKPQIRMHHSLPTAAALLRFCVLLGRTVPALHPAPMLAQRRPTTTGEQLLKGGWIEDSGGGRRFGGGGSRGDAMRGASRFIDPTGRSRAVGDCRRAHDANK